jgi:hypothetical protein
LAARTPPGGSALVTDPSPGDDQYGDPVKALRNRLFTGTTGTSIGE